MARYLFLIASVLWLIARAGHHHGHMLVRRAREVRVHRDAQPLPPRPAGATRPIPVLLPSTCTDTPTVPPLPAQYARPTTSLVLLTPAAHRARSRQQQRGLIVLLAIAKHSAEVEAAQAEAVAA